MNKSFIQAVRPYLCMLLLAVLACAARAQVEQGRFVGQVTDPQGAAIPGANVKLTNMGTNIVQNAVTNSTGEYVITPVPTGQYILSVSAPGFATTTTSSIEVQVGQIVREDLKLNI